MRERLFGYLNGKEKEGKETAGKDRQEASDELVIEENTIYEVDTECMDCLHKKRGL